VLGADGPRVARIETVPDEILPGDVWIVNDAATFPASLRGESGGHALETRLLPPEKDGPWPAVLFGEGDWRIRTEDRPSPPVLEPGSVIMFGETLRASVASVSSRSPRLVRLRFDREGAELWREIYRIGRPVQYSYVERDLELWSVQTPFASRPWASEMPSAARPLRVRLIRAIRERGGIVRSLTHATGLSSSGDAALDEAFPLPERSLIPGATIESIRAAKSRGSRVVAVGTSVLRALEDRAVSGLEPGDAVSRLRIDGTHQLRVADGILSGIHLPGESHFDLLEAFAPRETLLDAIAVAEREGFLSHEFGDSMLVWKK
jgi:S-adenosylmethionine:tRNA ribosyltransferase-isomerase